MSGLNHQNCCIAQIVHHKSIHCPKTSSTAHGQSDPMSNKTKSLTLSNLKNIRPYGPSSLVKNNTFTPFFSLKRSNLIENRDFKDWNPLCKTYLDKVWLFLLLLHLTNLTVFLNLEYMNGISVWIFMPLMSWSHPLEFHIQYYWNYWFHQS